MAETNLSPRLKKKEREKLWLWFWVCIVSGGLLGTSVTAGVNVLKSEEIAGVLITSKGGPKTTRPVSPADLGVPEGGAAAPAAEESEEDKKAKRLAVEKASRDLEAATKAAVAARDLKKGAKNEYDKLVADDNAKPEARKAAKKKMNESEASYQKLNDAFLESKATMEALRGEAKLAVQRAELQSEKAKLTEAYEEWKKGQQEADGGDNRSTFSLAIEYILMIGLWGVFCIAIAGFYLVWTVRRRAFYRGQKHRMRVIQCLAESIRGSDDPEERWQKFRRARKQPGLTGAPGDVVHLDELVHQISRAAIGSDTNLDRYFMTQSRDIKEEEGQRLAIVTMAGSLGPVLGFSGTVLGMIMAFSQLGSGTMSQEMIGEISIAINVALVTTLIGLLIKGIAMIVRTWVLNRIDGYVLALFLIPSDVEAVLAAEDDLGDPTTRYAAKPHAAAPAGAAEKLKL